MKHQLFFIITIIFCNSIFSQQIPLSEFNLSNSAAPAFVLLEETPTEVYVPENLKALTIHALSNFNESLSVEVNPYYFLGVKDKNKKRTFYNYIGIAEENGVYKQKPFSGITRATSLSFAFLNKDFDNLSDGDKKVYSLGFRTKIFRLYQKKKVETTYKNISKILQNIVVTPEVLAKANETDDENEKQKIIRDFYNTDEAISQLKEGGLYKTIKPIFQIDGALGYSILFEENSINSSTLNRFGTWLTSELSLPINLKKEESKTNNYINAFVVVRYVEDGFNLNSNNLFYRDLGGKIELEIGKFNFGYEYIKRNGSVESERSVGNIKFLINKDVSITGGFGKDFSSEENLVTLFGINWGLNLGSN